MSAKTYLVTGGAGFIGSHIVNALRERGENVRIFDVVNGDDIRFSQPVGEAMEGVDCVIHQAAIPSVQRSLETPRFTNSVNVEGTLNLLMAAHNQGVKRFVYASSSSVYGKNAECPKYETMTPRPISPYAVSKYAGELYCQAFKETYDLPIVILRYFNVFGPGQKVDGPYAAVIPKFLKAYRDGTTATVYGDGLQARDFTYVDNVVVANLLACEKDEAVGETFNIGTGVETSLKRLLTRIARITWKTTSVRYEEARKGDVWRSVACINKAHKLLDYCPEIDLDSGLALTWEWIKNESVVCSR